MKIINLIIVATLAFYNTNAQSISVFKAQCDSFIGTWQLSKVVVEDTGKEIKFNKELLIVAAETRGYGVIYKSSIGGNLIRSSIRGYSYISILRAMSSFQDPKLVSIGTNSFTFLAYYRGKLCRATFERTVT